MKSISISPVWSEWIKQEAIGNVGLYNFLNVFSRNAHREDVPGMHSDFILKSLNDVVWSFDLTGNGKNYVSHSAEAIYGRPVSELETRPFFWVDYTHPEDIHIMEKCHRTLSEKGTAECTYRIIARDNKVRWIFSRGNAVRDNQGNVIRIEGVSTDVTYFKHAESIIEKQEFQIEAVFENLDMSLIILDDQGKILVFNRAARDFASSRGITLKKGERYVGLGVGDLRQGIQSIFESVLREKQVRNCSASYLIDNVEYSFVVDYIPVFNAMGDVSQVCIMARDITRQKRLEEHTRELNQALLREKRLVEMKNQFVSMASHEFRTPLATIQLAAGFVKQFHSQLSSEVVSSKLGGIEKQVQLMITLLDDILTIGKTEAGKLKVNPVEIDVKGFMEGIIKEVEHSTGNTHSIHATYSESPLLILSDEKFLRNIFVNLLTNAVKFSPGRTAVFVDVEKKAGTVCIKVKDQGIGIPADEMNTIFEPFKRGNNVEQIGGTGLGLSIVRKAVDALKGELVLNSLLGVGSEFVVKLPVR